MARAPMVFTKKKIGVLMGGLSSEREISIRTGRAVARALRAAGYHVTVIDAGRDLCSKLKRRGVDAAFIALHGRFGEDGSVQGLLEVMGIPYTGSGVLASALSMDKAAAKKIFIYHGIPTPRFVEDVQNIKGRLKLPVVVKPSREGSTIGVTVVRKISALKKAVEHAEKSGGGVIIEEFIEGRELTVSILDGTVLPVIEIRPGQGLYDYRAKYTKGVTEFFVPAPLKKGVEKKVKETALSAYRALSCRGAARVDIVLDREERPFVLEVNTVPGLTETSLFPMAAGVAGMDYKTLVTRMMEGAGTGKN